MIANKSKYFLGYLNKLVDECNNNYYCSISKNTYSCVYSAFTEEIETNPKVSSFKLVTESKLQKI